VRNTSTALFIGGVSWRSKAARGAVYARMIGEEACE